MTDLAAPVYQAACPKCDAPPRQKCRDAFGHPTAPHHSRIEATTPKDNDHG